jgi:hypothetical protein
LLTEDCVIQFFLPSFMSFSKRPGNQSTELFMSQGKTSPDGKSSFDVTDDLEHATSLSYTSHIPLSRNPAQPTTPLPPQHGENPSQTQDDREGDPQPVYFDSHQQQHHNPPAQAGTCSEEPANLDKLTSSSIPEMQANSIWFLQMEISLTPRCVIVF